MYNPTPNSISQNWNECLFFHSYSLSLFYPNNHNPSSHSKSHTDSSHAWQWETSKSDPTIDTQTNKSYHTQSIHESGSRKSRNSSTTPHVFPEPHTHHREPWYPQSCLNDVSPSPQYTCDHCIIYYTKLSINWKQDPSSLSNYLCNSSDSALEWLDIDDPSSRIVIEGME